MSFFQRNGPGLKHAHAVACQLKPRKKAPHVKGGPKGKPEMEWPLDVGPMTITQIVAAAAFPIKPATVRERLETGARELARLIRPLLTKAERQAHGKKTTARRMLRGNLYAAERAAKKAKDRAGHKQL